MFYDNSAMTQVQHTLDPCSVVTILYVQLSLDPQSQVVTGMVTILCVQLSLDPQSQVRSRRSRPPYIPNFSSKKRFNKIKTVSYNGHSYKIITVALFTLWTKLTKSTTINY